MKKKLSSIFLCIILLQAFVSNISLAKSTYSTSSENLNFGSIGTRSTHAYAEKSEVEFGENIVIFYYFDDKPHTVKIDVYRNSKFQNTYYKYSGNLGDIFEFKSNQYSEDGTYRFEISPIDIDNGENYSASVSVNVYQHRIIFIPGIMGTELYSGSKKIWLPPDNLPKAIFVNQYINQLKMYESGESVDNTIVPGDPISDYYKSFETYFTKKHFKVVNVGYDWRADIKQNVAKLKRIVDTEVKNKHSSSKIFVVAHSMGGLLATEYINEGHGKNIDKLVTIGTPYLGAPQALYIFTTGHVVGRTFEDSLTGDAFREVMRNVYSAYQLLPSKNFFDYNSATYVTKKSYVGLPWFGRSESVALNYDETKKFLKNTAWSNNKMVDQSESFHNSLNILKSLSSVNSYYIIGDGIDSVSNLTMVGVDSGFPRIDKITYQKGDGTVLRNSATVGNRLDPSRTYYIREDHTSLVSNSNVQMQVLNILNGKPNELAPKISKKKIGVASVSLQSEGPVELHVNDTLGNHVGINGEDFDQNIPYSNYYSDGDNRFITLDEDNYTVKMKGTGYGYLVYTLAWTNENEIEDKVVRFDAIRITPKSVLTSETNRDGQITLHIDIDGDGVIDRNLLPSVELSREDILDETIPTITSKIDGVKGVNEWYGKDVYYNILGEDNESGVYKIFYDLNDSGYKEYTGPIPLPDTGIYKFKSFVRDKNRNDSEILIETVKVDTTNPTKPTMTIVPLKWTNKFVSITLSDSQDADSGFQKYQYKIGKDGEWKDYSTPIIIDTEGLYNIYARTVDNVFNLSDEVVDVAKVDKTKPSMPSGFEILLFNYNQVKISWLPSNDNVGVTSYDVYQDSEFVGSTTEAEFTFNNLVPDRYYTFSVVARDEATNSSHEGVFIVRTPKSLIGAGSNHTLQVKANGSVLAWGSNNHGELGDGTTTAKTTA
ncbi:esterase/lipase family protein, partial [Paenibacillus aceti]